MNRPLPERVNVSSVFDPIGEWKFSPFNHDFANCCETQSLFCLMIPRMKKRLYRQIEVLPLLVNQGRFLYASSQPTCIRTVIAFR